MTLTDLGQTDIRQAEGRSQLPHWHGPDLVIQLLAREGDFVRHGRHPNKELKKAPTRTPCVVGGAITV